VQLLQPIYMYYTTACTSRFDMAWVKDLTPIWRWVGVQLTPHLTQSGPFWRQSSQPITWYLQENIQTKYNSKKNKQSRTKRTELPWFSRFLQHSARKQDGLIQQCCRAIQSPTRYTRRNKKLKQSAKIQVVVGWYQYVNFDITLS